MRALCTLPPLGTLEALCSVAAAAVPQRAEDGAEHQIIRRVFYDPDRHRIGHRHDVGRRAREDGRHIEHLLGQQRQPKLTLHFHVTRGDDVHHATDVARAAGCDADHGCDACETVRLRRYDGAGGGQADHLARG